MLAHLRQCAHAPSQQEFKEAIEKFQKSKLWKKNPKLQSWMSKTWLPNSKVLSQYHIKFSFMRHNTAMYIHTVGWQAKASNFSLIFNSKCMLFMRQIWCCVFCTCTYKYEYSRTTGQFHDSRTCAVVVELGLYSVLSCEVSEHYMINLRSQIS